MRASPAGGHCSCALETLDSRGISGHVPNESDGPAPEASEGSWQDRAAACDRFWGLAQHRSDCRLLVSRKVRPITRKGCARRPGRAPLADGRVLTDEEAAARQSDLGHHGVEAELPAVVALRMPKPPAGVVVARLHDGLIEIVACSPVVQGRGIRTGFDHEGRYGPVVGPLR